MLVSTTCSLPFTDLTVYGPAQIAPAVDHDPLLASDCTLNPQFVSGWPSSIGVVWNFYLTLVTQWTTLTSVWPSLAHMCGRLYLCIGTLCVNGTIAIGWIVSLGFAATIFFGIWVATWCMAKLIGSFLCTKVSLLSHTLRTQTRRYDHSSREESHSITNRSPLVENGSSVSPAHGCKSPAEPPSGTGQPNRERGSTVSCFRPLILRAVKIFRDTGGTRATISMVDSSTFYAEVPEPAERPIRPDCAPPFVDIFNPFALVRHQHGSKGFIVFLTA